MVAGSMMPVGGLGGQMMMGNSYVNQGGPLGGGGSGNQGANMMSKSYY